MTEGPIVLGERYELGELLGRGGMAEVHRARDLRLGRDVAIKRLRIDLAGDTTFQARFRREAKSSAMLNHPNIVSVYDTGEAVDPATGVAVPYIVMELIEGRTLRDLLRDGRKIIPRKALEFVQGVLNALSNAHNAGIVHRDIKPANVMLTRTGQVKVMDFGIARAVADTSATMTQTAAVIGTAQYLSPEQARGETVDTRSDLYSTGCLLYELLTGRPPFQGDSPVSVAYQHVREAPVPPSQIDPTLTREMDLVVLKALAKDPNDRYQTAAAMSEDIGRLLTGKPVTATVVAPVPSARVTAEIPAPTMVAATSSAMPNTAKQPIVGAEASQGPVTLTQPGMATRALVPTGRSKSRAPLIVTVVIVLVALLGTGAWYVWNGFIVSQKVRVPSVVTLSRSAAEDAIRNVGLVPTVTEVKGPDDNTVDSVTAQNPLADTEVRLGSTVQLTVNVGPGKATIPPGLVGKDQAVVEVTLRTAGFTNITTTQDATSTAVAGIVTKITPAEGSNISINTEIVLSVATGTARVPNLLGLNKAQAEAEARNAGFTNLSWTTAESSTATPGTVISQLPTSGQTASTADTLSIVLAVPPVATPTPSRPSPSPTATGA